MANDYLSSSELTKFIEASGESSNIDAKGPMSWDSGIESAALAKDIAAFANSRDGGVLVIGKSEGPKGRFDFTGLTEDQAGSFETTKVAKWVNNRFSPPVSIVCHEHERQGAIFVVITIAEFDDVPILCTKSFQDPANPNKHILRERTIYVRNMNAESAPLETLNELRTLIGLATAKRSQEMITTFESMLKGRPLLPQMDDESLFEKERMDIENHLGQSYAKQLQAGAWKLVIHPSRFEAERWPEGDQLEGVIRRRSVRLREEFPAYQRGTHMREWGICNDTYGETWTLARSGQFMCARPYWENHRAYECKWRDLTGNPTEPNIEAGQWLDFKPNIFSITEMFMFIARFVEEYEPGEQVSILIEATSLAGRKLVTTDFRINLRDSEPCRANLFEFKKSLPMEDLRTEWEGICAETMKRFVELCTGPGVEIKTMQKWIEKFKTRNF